MPMTPEQLVRQIRCRISTLLLRAAPLCAAYRVPVPDPQLSFDLRGLSAGQAVWRRRLPPLLRFNLDIATRHSDDFLEHTVAHEVAHLITAACHGRTRPHGPEWRKVMHYLGIDDPCRCHTYALDESRIRRQRRWSYSCACSRHELSTTRHNRIQNRGQRYHCRRCGGALQRVPD